MSDRYGLEWVDVTFGLEPRWTTEPDITIITQLARKHLSLDDSTPVNATFHAQGAFNKLYRISSDGPECLMRVSLPVQPRLKTESEVATINFISQETSMPVPRILAFDSDSGNELRFEWSLMEMMPGVPLGKRWRKMSWVAKETIVRQLAGYQAQLFAKRFEKIGNLFPCENSQAEAPEGCQLWYRSFVLGRIVSLIFFWGDHATHDAPRGPFETSHDWLQARLSFVITDQDHILKTSDDEDDIEDAEAAKDLAERLINVIPGLFPPHLTEAESSVLFHDDLSMQNTLVDEEGRLTALIDWECVSAVPLWRACQFPQLLEGSTREEKPDATTYARDLDHGYESSAATDAPDNEGINSLYWIHLLEYEQTLLRKLFIDEMERLNPEWVTIMRSNTIKLDFEKAIHGCNGFGSRFVKHWLEAYMEGNVRSLEL